jgi:L-2-amino-thiazoline-4-carboxylic acid hydrolase
MFNLKKFRRYSLDVEKMTNYGKGIVESLSSPEYKKIEKQMFIPIIGVLRKKIGIIGLLKLFLQWRSEEKKMRQNNWVKLEKKGVPKEVFQATFQLVALMKVLDCMVGIEKARGIITEIYEQTEEVLQRKKSAVNLFSIPVGALKTCNDSFLAFKKYTKAQVYAGVKEKLHESEIIEDTDDVLSFNINYCVVHEVAKEYGNAAWSFPWCEIDDVVYPKMGKQLGFKYTRSGSLPAGASTCDFRYERFSS